MPKPGMSFIIPHEHFQIRNIPSAESIFHEILPPKKEKNTPGNEL
jgi:hypothetical protein